MSQSPRGSADKGKKTKSVTFKRGWVEGRGRGQQPETIFLRPINPTPNNDRQPTNVADPPTATAGEILLDPLVVPETPTDILTPVSHRLVVQRKPPTAARQAKERVPPPRASRRAEKPFSPPPGADVSAMLFDTAFDDANAALEALGPNSREPSGRRLKRLKDATQNCYQWFNAQHTPSWSTLEPARREQERPIRALMYILESAHAQLVGAMAKEADGTPPMVFADGVSHDERAAARKIFRQLAIGETQISLPADDLARSIMLARLVRLLETSTGIKVLRKLVEERKTVHLTEKGVEPSLEHGHGLPPADLTTSHPRYAERLTREERDDKYNMRPSPRGAVMSFPKVATPMEVTEAVIAGAKGFTVTHEGTDLHYEFPGPAVSVGVHLGRTSDPHADAEGEAIHTPRWITLGRELGRGLHQLYGAASTQGRNQELLRILAPGVADPQARWNSVEDLILIKGIENGLRREVGLRDRGQFPSAVDPAVAKRRAATTARIEQYIQILQGKNLQGDDKAGRRTQQDLNTLRRVLESLHRMPLDADDAQWRQWCEDTDRILGPG
jgi:hypothetical protein